MLTVMKSADPARDLGRPEGGDCPPLLGSCEDSRPVFITSVSMNLTSHGAICQAKICLKKIIPTSLTSGSCTTIPSPDNCCQPSSTPTNFFGCLWLWLGKRDLCLLPALLLRTKCQAGCPSNFCPMW